MNKYLHRLIFEDFYGEIPEGYHIHHKNGNKLDNCILNLQLVNEKLHVSQHSQGENNGMYGKHHSEESRRKMGDTRRGKPIHLDEKLKISGTTSSSGYFRVTKRKDNHYTQGYCWAYQYYDEKKKRRRIHAVSIEKLKEKVLAKGLIWAKLDC